MSIFTEIYIPDMKVMITLKGLQRVVEVLQVRLQGSQAGLNEVGDADSSS